MKINVKEIIPINVSAELVCDSGNNVPNDKQCDLEASEQLNTSLVLRPCDIGELYQMNALHLISDKGTVPEDEIDPGPTPAIQGIYSIWISYIQDVSFKSLIMTIMLLMPLFKTGPLEVEIDPGPYEYLIAFIDILDDFKTWIAYIENLRFKFSLITTMIIMSLFEIENPEMEVDPGPHQHPVAPDHVNKSITKIIIHGALIIFQTWIAYIHKLLPNYLDQLNFDFCITEILTPSTIPQHHSRNMFNYTEETYLYHDHYMIPAIQFQASSNRSFNYQRFVYTTTWKGVRFKTIPFKITMSAKSGQGVNAVPTSSFIPILF
jgi:hypothetical protein